MRLFIAALFDSKTVDTLSQYRDALHDASISGTFVPRDNLHLTLEFLGECSASERDEAIDSISTLSFSPFSLTFNRLGFFSRDDGDIWWIGCEDNRELMTLHSTLHRELINKGFNLEKRRYKPHITLGRRVVTKASSGRIEPFDGRVENVSLMLSERINGQMVYTPLFSIDGVY